MRCEQAREALWPEPQAGPARQEAFAHYGACPACQRFFAAQGALGDRLARLQRAPAPRGLRDRVAAHLSAETVAARLAVRRGGLRWLAGGGGALLAAAAALVLLINGPDVPDHIAEPLVQEAQRGVTALALATDDYSRLQTWFDERLGYTVHVPEISDADLVGGRLTEFGGVRTVAVLYLYHDAPITYFAWPTATVMGREVPGDRIVSGSAAGHVLAVWTERGYARAVVAAMPRSDVMGFAIECRAKAMMSTTTSRDGREINVASAPTPPRPDPRLSRSTVDPR